MANEFIARNGITSLGNIVVSGSITTTGTVAISGSIASASFATSASFAATASSADNFLTRGTLTAQTLVVQTITSSVDFVTGSTRFGSLLTNTHVFSGSVTINPNGLFVSSSGNVGVNTSTFENEVFKFQVGNRGSDTRTLFAPNNGFALALANGTSSLWYMGVNAATAANGLQFYSNELGGVAVTMTTAGNVGIGITNPQAFLHIAGQNGKNALTIGASNNYEIFITGSDSANIYHASPNQAIYLNTNGGALHLGPSAASTLLTITGSNVGIGTSSPSVKLHVIGNALFDNSSFGSAQIRLKGTGTTTGFDIQNDSNDGYLWNRDSGNIYFATNNTERMRITSGGNVGIGTTPSAWGSIFSGGVFQVKNSSLLAYNNNTYLSTNAYFTNTTDNYIGNGFASRYIQISGQHIWENASNNTSGADAVLTLVERMRITSGGNVGIATTTIPNNLGTALQIGSTVNFMSYVGNAYFLNNWYYDSSGNAKYITSNFASGITQNGSGELRFFTNASGTANATFTPTERLVIANGGNVGIGTIEPTATLQVRGPNATGVFFDAQNLGAGGAVFSRINASSAPFNQYVFNNGNVGVNRTPLSQLAVYGGPVQIMQDYPGHQTIIRSTGTSGVYSGQLTVTIPEMSGAGSSQGFGGYSCEIYVAGFQGMYCHAWFSGYNNNGLSVSEATILRSSGGWSISQTVTGTFSQGFIFYIDYPASIVHPTARIIFNKGGDPNIAEYNANAITATWS